MDRVRIFQQLPQAHANDIFLGLRTREQVELLLALPVSERRLWVRLLAPDDAADLIQAAPPGEREGLLAQLDVPTRREVMALLAYAEDVAGGLMNPRFARLRPEMPVDEAIAYLRLQADHVETIYYVYVLGADQRLLGVVTFRSLLTAPKTCTVRETMRTDVVTVSEDMDQEAVAVLFAEYQVLALPVVDTAGHMKGIVTLDDIVAVVEEEASEDIHKLGGMEALDAPYLLMEFGRMVKKRAGWLAALFLGEMLTATAMGYFEEDLARAIVLALFIPLIISSGGNAGSQAATLVSGPWRWPKSTSGTGGA
jgi:magnesium transporter